MSIICEQAKVTFLGNECGRLAVAHSYRNASIGSNRDAFQAG
jgi:hypothetical protein